MSGNIRVAAYYGNVLIRYRRGRGVAEYLAVYGASASAALVGSGYSED